MRATAEHKDDVIIDLNSMRALRSTIEPSPHEVHAPEKEAEDIPGLFAQRADFLYEAGTRYRFTVDLVPGYVALERDKTTRCFSLHHFQSERDPSKAFARMLSREGTTSYRVSIGFTMFDGRIDSFSDEGALYRNFRTDGVLNCRGQ